MRFSKYLVKTFLVFAASGAGTAAGFGVVTIGILLADKKLKLNKPSENKIETPTADTDEK
jgi:hypothetical protein